MNNELTNVYAILRKEFRDVLGYFDLLNSKELAAFLHYNAHNELFVGTDDEYYHNVNFRNLDTGRSSRVFREGYLYFFPKTSDIIQPDNHITVFSISKGTKCIKVNENGLFIENNNLAGNILTEYYDNAALEALGKEGISAGNIDYIEDYIRRLGIQPDKIFVTHKENEELIVSTLENGEEVERMAFPIQEGRTFYSMYYENMKAKGYFSKGMQQENSATKSH